MTTYTNPTGTFTATSGNDTIIFNRLPSATVAVDASGGSDSLSVSLPSTEPVDFYADSTSSDAFYVNVRPGPYNPMIIVDKVEHVRLTGTSSDDTFTLKIGPDLSGLSADFDGGAGVDTLTFDFSNVPTSQTFQATGTSITSSFGSFSNFEQFNITAGSGNDSITTGDYDDNIITGSGVDTVHAGGGNDYIASTSDGGRIDGGAGFDFYSGDFDYSTPLTVTFGSTISISNGVTISNVEHGGIGTGSGDDHFYVTSASEFTVDGGDGYDTFVYNVPTSDGQDFSFHADAGMLWGSAGGFSFGAMERVELHGGDGDDTFTISPYPDQTYDPGAVLLDGGAGADRLVADFSYFADATIFTTAEDGSVTSNRGEFLNIESFTIQGGAQADRIATGSGNDTLHGGDGDDLLNGGAGDDVLWGDAGTDTLIGGAGNDTLHGYDDGTSPITPVADILMGGMGDDVYDEKDEVNTIIEHAGEGFDTVISSVDYVLPANVEQLTLVGYQGVSYGNSPPTSGTGNSGDNVINGNEVDNVLRGLAGNDTLDGGEGNDTLDGGTGRDTASYADATFGVTVRLGTASPQDTGAAGIDTLISIENLTGSAFADQLTGDSSANILDGGAGNDTLDGLAGVDTASYADASAGVIVRLETTAAQNTGGAGLDTLASIENLTGSAYADSLSGTSEANVLSGLAGADKLVGLAGNDVLDGGAGSDAMYGGSGNDTYFVDDTGDRVFENAGAGTDLVRSSIGYALSGNVESLTLTGSAAINGVGNGLNNFLNGNSAANELNGRAGADAVDGGGGDDTLIGGEGNDRLDGGAGRDTASYADSATGVAVSLGTTSAQNTGGAGIDTLISIENLTGSAFTDHLTGNSGANVLDGGAGNDSLDGGTGTDTASYADSTAGVTVSLGTMSAQNTGGAGTDTLNSIENLTGSNFADRLTGSSDANVLFGLDGNDHIYGLAGADKLLGYAGNDVVDGGTGADVMFGGLDNDNYYVDDVHDKVVENVGEGNDTVHSSVSYSLSSSVENLILTGSAVRAVGNNLANHLVGNSGANFLNGGTGADLLSGGGGDDTYYVDNPGDRVAEGNSSGHDQVNSTISYALASNVEDLFLRGSAAINATGNNLDNVLQGNSAANVLNGALGDDKLNAGGGADTLNGGGGADKMTGGAGSDTFVFRDGDFGGLTNQSCDEIRDFSHSQGDSIDLTGVDANALASGSQDFTFIGSAGFHGVAGELRYEIIGANTYVYGDTDGDGLADLMIRLDGSHAMASGDFLIGG